MSSANPLSFLGGMFLEIGAAIAVLAILWQPQQGDARPVQSTDYFASRPVQFSTNHFSDRGNLQPELPSYQPVAQYPPVNQWPVHSQPNWNEVYRLLPPAPAAYAELPRETRIETARPLVRGFAERSNFEQPQSPRYAPVQRTAEAQREHFHNRY